MKSWLKKKLSSVVVGSDDGSDEIDRDNGGRKGKKEKGLATPQRGLLDGEQRTSSMTSTVCEKKEIGTDDRGSRPMSRWKLSISELGLRNRGGNGNGIGEEGLKSAEVAVPLENGDGLPHKKKKKKKKKKEKRRGNGEGTAQAEGEDGNGGKGSKSNHVAAKNESNPQAASGKDARKKKHSKERAPGLSSSSMGGSNNNSSISHNRNSHHGRASTHDVSMAAHALGVKSTRAAEARAVQSAQNGTDDDYAVAYRIAEEERHLAAMRGTQLHPPNQYSQQIPDMLLASELAESQFSARQAQEISKTQDAVFEAAISKAMEVSLETVSHDNLLREIKLWTIDLAGASDEVMSALEMISKRRKEASAKLERAIEKNDSNRVAKILWETEQLPLVELKMQQLLDNMVPVGVAASDLQALREQIMEVSPPVEEAEARKEQIIDQMFQALKSLKLSVIPGPSTGHPESDDFVDSADLREFVSALVDNAKRIPRVPVEMVKEANEMIHESHPCRKGKEVKGSRQVVDLGSHTIALSASREETSDETRTPSEARTEISSTLTEKEVLLKANQNNSLSFYDASLRGSSNVESIRKIGEKARPATREKTSKKPTQPEPFNLSKSRPTWQPNTKKKMEETPIRRVPAFFTLNHEFTTDQGIVGQTVGWENREYPMFSMFEGVDIPAAPNDTEDFSTQNIDELIDYVQKHRQDAHISSPGSSFVQDKWSTMCDAANAATCFKTASESFLTWGLKDGEDIIECCHRLKCLVSQVLEVLGTVAYPHDNLRVSMKKYNLPWDEKLINQVRWDAQHAAAVVMREALAWSDDQGRKLGTLRRQKNELRPLGHALVSSFSVHQLSGGFGGEAAELCDDLLDRTVHCARQLDPKWFRGTKVVKS
eukprot:jgi/Picsp_1/6848/NSC_04185-R1_hypothetical protein CHLNCDRAFT_57951 [Chlorella variabilis]